MLLVIEEVKVQLCQVNRELTTLELALHDKDQQTSTLQEIEKEIATYTTRQRQSKRDKLKQVNLDYQEGRVYPWLTGITRSRRKARPRPAFNTQRERRSPTTSESERPTENPSTDSEAGISSNTTVHIKKGNGSLFPKADGVEKPGGASRGRGTYQTRSGQQRTDKRVQ